MKAFSQADTSITRQHGGTGLGLVISQRLIQAMGGDHIGLESQQGKGSSFSFELPLKNCSQSELAQLFEAGTSEHPEQLMLTGHILLVEDNSINQEVAKAQLTHIGLQVTLAENGQQAVEKVKKQTFDAVLMDIQMPIMDGYEASKQIRKFNTQIPIIALTAAAMIEDKHKAMAAGMNGHLGKPIDTSELSQMLSQWLPKHSVQTDNTQPITPPQEGVAIDAHYLNIEQGLTLLGQDHHLYAHLLEHFDEQITETFMPLIALLHEVIQQDDPEHWTLAQQTAHSLKGVAGNLAAQALAQQSAEIDALLKKKTPPSLPQIDQFHDTMTRTQTYIRRWMAQQTPESIHAPEVQWDNQALLHHLTQLHEQVMNNEFIDEHHLSQITEQLFNTEQAHTWQNIQHALDGFDFDEASAQLTQLIQHYASLTGTQDDRV